MSPQAWLVSVCVLASWTVVLHQGPAAAATTRQPLTVSATASSGEGSSLSVTEPSATAATTQPLIAVGSSSADTSALSGSVTSSTEGSSLSVGLSSAASVPGQAMSSSTNGQDPSFTGRPEPWVVSSTWPAPVDGDSSPALKPASDSPISFVSDVTASSSTSTMSQLTRDDASSISETTTTTLDSSTTPGLPLYSASPFVSATPGPKVDTLSVSPSDSLASSVLTTDGATSSVIFTSSVLTTDGLTSSIFATDSSSGSLTVYSITTARSTSEINTAVEERPSSTESHTTQVFTASRESSATVDVETSSASPSAVGSTTFPVPGSTQSLVDSETTPDPMQENTKSSLTSPMASTMVGTASPATFAADTTSPQTTHVSATGASETLPGDVTSAGKVRQSGSTQAETVSGGSERSQVSTEATDPFTAPPRTHQPSEPPLTIASSSSTQTTAIIAGSVVGGLAAVVVAGVLVFVLCRRKSSSSPKGSDASPQRNGSSVRPAYGPKYKNPLFNLTTTASGSDEP